MELIVDNFAGGGGASTGIEMALGRPVDHAINHDQFALGMHRINHPRSIPFTWLRATWSASAGSLRTANTFRKLRAVCRSTKIFAAMRS